MKGRRRQIFSGQEPGFHWLSGFGDQRPESVREHEARINLRDESVPAMPTCDDYVDSYLADYARRVKASSLHTQTSRLRRFREDFKGRSLDLSRAELKEWINAEGPWSDRQPIPPCELPAIISLYNHAIDESDLPIMRSPARKLTPRSRGRADEPPPSPEEFQAILDSCSVLGSYGKMMRALLLFATYTLMRPSELFALEWSDIDFKAKRIRTLRRVYRGTVDVPKTGKRTIALTPPAKYAIWSLPRDSDLVFTSQGGKRLASTRVWHYWDQVLNAAGLRFEFYHATKHYGVHYMWNELKMSPRAIAAQAGWRLNTVNRMLAIYGHFEIGALKEVDEAFRIQDDFPGRDVAERLDSWVSRTPGPTRSRPAA